MIENIGQVLGYIAAVFNILSYQCKTHKKVTTMLLIGGIFFCASFLMTGAVTGGILNGISVIRGIVYTNKEKFNANHIGWFIGFCVTYAITYVLTFTVFNKPFNFANAILELLPVVGMVATNISFRMSEARHIRALAYVSSPSWLIYNIVNQAQGAIVTEVIALISVTIAVLRLDIKRKNKTESVVNTQEQAENGDNKR